MIFERADHGRRIGRGQLFWRVHRSGGARRKLLFFLVLLALFVAFLPVLVTKTPLRDAVVAAAMPGGALRVTIGEASLGWFSGLSLSQVEVWNEAGDKLLAAETITMDRSPIQLLANRRDLGTIDIAKPTLHIKIRPDGSNLEDALSHLLAAAAEREPPSPDDGAASQVQYSVRLSEGTVVAEDLSMNRAWRVENVDLQYDSGGANGGLGQWSLTAQFVDVAADGAAPATAGQIALTLTSNDGQQQLAWQTEGLPLAMAEPWLRRFIVAADASGTLASQGNATWTAAAPTDLNTSGYLSISRLDASAPALHGDRIRLERLELPWRLTAAQTGLKIEDLQLQSDIGRAAMRGTIDATALTNGGSIREVVLSAGKRHDVELRGVLDVERLAAMLPRALRIRDDTAITSGTIELSGRCQPAGSGQRITGSVRTSQLSATSGGRPLHWNQPITANVSLTREVGALRLEELACDSEFLQISARGTPQEFTAAASFDLNRLSQQLGQFVDLSGMELAGTGEAKFDWSQEAADAFSARAAGSLAQLRIALAEGGAWVEPQLEMRANAGGRLDTTSGRPTRLDNGELQVSAQKDELAARLTGPVELSSPAPVWPASIEATGRIARWLTRVRPWFSPDPWQVDGVAALTTRVRVSSQSFEAEGTALSVTDLRAVNPEWDIRESRVELAGDVRWNGASGELAMTAGQLVTSTVSLAVKDVAYRPARDLDAPGATQFTGAAAFRTDLARLASWQAQQAGGAEYRPQGALTGNVRFAQQNGRVVGELVANGENLALTQKSTTKKDESPLSYEFIWQEPKVSARGQVVYEPATDQLAFQQFQIQSNTLQAAVNGQIDQLSTASNLNVAGTLNYDLAQLTPLLRPYVGEGIQLIGRERARFALAGQLTSPTRLTAQPVGLSSQSAIHNPQSAIPLHWSRRIRAQLEMPWSGAKVYGLPVGTGRLAATLGEGAVRVEPLKLAVGEGKLTASPYVRLDPAPSELLLPAGPLITNVRISPEVSDAMLKYVAPVLAGATQSEGLFSMQLEGARVPLEEPRRADSAGKLTVHSVRVVPGAMVREWIGLAQQIEAIAKRKVSSPNPSPKRRGEDVTLLSIRDQQVNFRMVDGRVHHENMEFQVGDVVMRSQGSVGLDETLSLVLRVPIQDAWVADQPLLAGLKGQSLQVPITGTLTRPKMDPRAVATLSQQLLQNAAGQAIGNEINKALDKLFKQN